MPFAEAADYRFNPVDLTKVRPHADYPPITSPPTSKLLAHRAQPNGTNAERRG
jgi:hypothetical protein